jgi:hypothetical protein
VVIYFFKYRPRTGYPGYLGIRVKLGTPGTSGNRGTRVRGRVFKTENPGARSGFPIFTQYPGTRSRFTPLSRMGLAKQCGGMGFRDLSAFNLALLAKQGWRILQNPNSLVAHILQEKYIWRSLLEAWPLLESGLKWRIGNGEQVRILGDKWVDKSPNFQIQTLCNVLDPEARVSSLIDPVMGW